MMWLPSPLPVPPPSECSSMKPCRLSHASTCMGGGKRALCSASRDAGEGSTELEAAGVWHERAAWREKQKEMGWRQAAFSGRRAMQGWPTLHG